MWTLMFKIFLYPSWDCTGVHHRFCFQPPKLFTSLFLVKEERQGAMKQAVCYWWTGNEGCAHACSLAHTLLPGSCFLPFTQVLQKVLALARACVRICCGIKWPECIDVLNSCTADLHLGTRMLVLRQEMLWSSVPLEHSSSGTNTVFCGICLFQIQLINFYGINSKGAEITAFIFRITELFELEGMIKII